MLATNETHPVREFVERAFKFVKIDIQWQGEKGTVSEARPVHPWPLCLYTVCLWVVLYCCCLVCCLNCSVPVIVCPCVPCRAAG